MEFGILTLATKNDFRKAIGLALSARLSNPGVPLAVVCQDAVADVLRPYFDKVILEKKGLKGFRHKVYLDIYTPFENTFFFDSDVLIFRDLKSIVLEWSTQPYTATGIYLKEGFSSFGLDRATVLRKIGKENLVVIDGAGHAFFTAPHSKIVFDLARKITDCHLEYCGNIPYADEDVLDIVMSMMDLQPAPHADFFSRYYTAVPGTLKMDATRGKCEMITRHSGLPMKPYMMHFAGNEAPFTYAYQLYKLFKKNKVKTNGLLSEALYDSWIREFFWPVKNSVKKFLMQ